MMMNPTPVSAGGSMPALIPIMIMAIAMSTNSIRSTFFITYVFLWILRLKILLLKNIREAPHYLLATLFFLLDSRAFFRPETAKHTTIVCQRPQ